jgi:hypothetical protein
MLANIAGHTMVMLIDSHPAAQGVRRRRLTRTDRCRRTARWAASPTLGADDDPSITETVMISNSVSRGNTMGVRSRGCSCSIS